MHFHFQQLHLEVLDVPVSFLHVFPRKQGKPYRFQFRFGKYYFLTLEKRFFAIPLGIFAGVGGVQTVRPGPGCLFWDGGLRKICSIRMKYCYYSSGNWFPGNGASSVESPR
jgi:hypothetical protein